VRTVAKLFYAVKRALNIYGHDRDYIWYMYHNL
jgi:hypothetical protein